MAQYIAKSESQSGYFMQLYVGLMSGTSADGIDAAVVDFNEPTPKLIAAYYHPYTDELRKKIHALCEPGEDEIIRLAELDVLLGKEFANAANILLKNHGISAEKIQAIGSHGQTVRHYPHLQFTLQIADPNIIAKE